MGELVSRPYDVNDADAYVEHLEHGLREAERLMREGRIPSTEDVYRYVDGVRAASRQIAGDAANARARGETTVVSRFERTAAEHAGTSSLGEHLGVLLEILEMRDAADLRKTDASRRVAEALKGGTFVE